MKVSGRKNPRGKSTPARTERGSNTVTPSDDRSRTRSASSAKQSDAQKLEARKKQPNNRTKVKPIGKGRAGKAA